MHPSTIAAILAFTAGMTVNAVPVIRPEGTPEPPADRFRTTLENSQAQPQLSELAEDEYTIPSVEKRDPLLRMSNEPGRLAVEYPLPGLVDIPNQKRDPRVIDAGFGFDAGVTIDPSTITGGLKKLIPGQKEKRDLSRVIDNVVGRIAPVVPGGVKQFIPGQKEKRDPLLRMSNEPGRLAVEYPLPGLVDIPNQKRDPRVIDAGLGFDAGITINPSTITDKLKQFIPGQKEKRDSRIIGGSEFLRPDIGVLIQPEDGSPAYVVGGSSGSHSKRDPQIDAGFGFDAGITLEPTALPGHLKKLLPGQKNKRDPQSRGKGHIIGNIAKGVAGGIGAIADGLTINQALQGKQA